MVTDKRQTEILNSLNNILLEMQKEKPKEEDNNSPTEWAMTFDRDKEGSIDGSTIRFKAVK